MGSVSSRASRKLPTRLKPSPPWAGARTVPTSETKSSNPRASETRSAEIENDAGDPHFMSKLNKMGQVNVNHHMASFHTADMHMRSILNKREQSEQQADSPMPTQNRILASSLFDLLEQTKTISTRRELENVARKYGMDVSVLESVSRSVNTPSVDERTITKTVGEDGTENVTMMAIWSDTYLTRTR
ncbi:hypothetical protein BD410DRAFT_782645 [Rickenella mellea]|uniref:Uncharacterized protein n=1 Tax=Rickenella mellea TaxID=50990 RepID=A0A4Y7QKE0_9AGAM|nr:hypothetical protein BD410DRAFT_782645 [Rickenella mellea]